MILSDFDLENYIRDKRLVIKPFDKEQIRENGLDLKLGNEIAVHNPKLKNDFVLDPSNEKHLEMEYVKRKSRDRLVIPRSQQVLLTTEEYMEMPDNLMGFVELRSSWARHGLSMPPTIIDAGFKGDITLEVINHSTHAIAIKPGTRFAHIIFASTMNRVKHVYSGKYLGQRGVRLPKVL
jgi:dCTP deaminase